MAPIILISKNPALTDDFIKKYRAENHISEFDVFVFEPEKKDFSIDMVRELKKQIVTGSSGRRLMVLKSFDTATVEAQNAFLKTLEEKTDTNQFILEVQSPDRLLPTIHSRSQSISLDPHGGEGKTNATYEKLFDSIIAGKNYAFLADPSIQSITREAAFELLDASVLYLKNHLQSMDFSPAVIKKAFQVKSLLQSNNLNPQLSIDAYLIYFKKQSTQK